MSKLEIFKVKGLHGKKTIDVSIKDNILIVVGENGSGKTTFLRMLFCFLSGDWLQLSKFNFDSIFAKIDGNEFHISQDELLKAAESSSERRVFPANISRVLQVRVRDAIAHGNSEQLERISREYGIPTRMLLREFDLDPSEVRPDLKRVVDIFKQVQDLIGAQILYLPTYRRIERELGSIFQGADADDLKRVRRRMHHGEDDPSYIELVEFGMTDVQRAIERVLAGLKEFARQSLSGLTLRYLGDVVNRAYEQSDMSDVANASDETIAGVLNRIDEGILNDVEKSLLLKEINLTRSEQKYTAHSKIISHYLSKLLSFQQSLQEREKSISAFCELCSQYIVDKKFIYDSSTFQFYIVPEEAKSGKIELSELSSGEKQIVSLFSHLYLSGSHKYFVLIDEPELSLSVPWQKRFLTDIFAGGFCLGLVAVTHSPFIYENELKPYAHSLGEFSI